MSKFDLNRIKDGWEKLCTNKQTNKQTDRHYKNNGHLAVNQKTDKNISMKNTNTVNVQTVNSAIYEQV